MRSSSHCCLIYPKHIIGRESKDGIKISAKCTSFVRLYKSRCSICFVMFLLDKYDLLSRKFH